MTKEEWEEKKERLSTEMTCLNDVINSLDYWGPNAESLQRDYDYLLQEYNKHLKSK